MPGQKVSRNQTDEYRAQKYEEEFHQATNPTRRDCSDPTSM